MELSITEQLQYTTVRIEIQLRNGSISTGTGYFMKLLKKDNLHVPVIVTNKHVIENGNIGKFILTLADTDGNPIDTEHYSVELDNIEKRFIGHPEEDVDLCILPIAPIMEYANNEGKKLFFIPLEIDLIPTDEREKELSAVEDILMVGYPNGLWDSVNNSPIFRKGITATHLAKNYNGKEEFMIDAACFPGSSGSPVLLCNLGNYQSKNGGVIIGNRVMFLGTLYAGPQHTASGEIKVVTIPTNNIPYALSRIPNNLGYVIKAKKLLDFEKILLELVQVLK